MFIYFSEVLTDGHFCFAQVFILAADETRSDGGQVDLHRKYWSPAGLSPRPV